MKHLYRILSTAILALTLFAQPTLAGSREKLTIGIGFEFDTFHGLITQSQGATYINNTHTRSLTSYDADWQSICLLCTEVPSVENGKAKIIEEKGKKKILVEWEIKKNARWGDGKPITGHDVKFTWEVGKSKNVAVGSPIVFTIIEDINVDTKNPKKFTTKTKKIVNSYNTLNTFYVLPKHIEGPIFEKTKMTTGAYEKQTAFNNDPYNPGLYSGPYLVKETRPASHVVLEPNPYFYGAKPYFKQVVIRIIANTQALEASLIAGDIDMIGEPGITLDQALALKKRAAKNKNLASGAKVMFRPGMIYDHIAVNLGDPVLADLRVRQALIHAIDRQKLVDALFEGVQEVAIHNTHPLDGLFTDDVIKYDYDLKKANHLLDQVGWEMNKKDGYRYKDGKKLTFIMMAGSGNKVRELVEVFVQNEWKKAGIDMKIRNEPARVFFAETIRKIKYPHMAMFAWVSSPFNSPYSTNHSDNIPTPENSYSGQNVYRWRNKKVDEALDRELEELRLEKRKEYMKIVSAEYARELPAIPLYYRVSIAVVPPKLKGFKITGHQFLSTNFIEKWRLSQR